MLMQITDSQHNKSNITSFLQERSIGLHGQVPLRLQESFVKFNLLHVRVLSSCHYFLAAEVILSA